MDNNNLEIPETRGAKPKYDFNNLEIGETRTFENTSTGKILNSAKSFCNQRNLTWEFRCYTVPGSNGVTAIVRTS